MLEILTLTPPKVMMSLEFAMCHLGPIHHGFLKHNWTVHLVIHSRKRESSQFPPQAYFYHQNQQEPTMSDQQKPTSQRFSEPTPRSKQVVRLITATTIGATLLVLSTLTLTGTVVALILATPVLIIFSPILVPAATLLFLITVGFLFSGGCGVAAIAALKWIYNYVAGKKSSGSDQIDYASIKIASTAGDYEREV